VLLHELAAVVAPRFPGRTGLIGVLQPEAAIADRQLPSAARRIATAPKPPDRVVPDRLVSLLDPQGSIGSHGPAVAADVPRGDSVAT